MATESYYLSRISILADPGCNAVDNGNGNMDYTLNGTSEAQTVRAIWATSETAAHTHTSRSLILSANQEGTTYTDVAGCRITISLDSGASWASVDDEDLQHVLRGGAYWTSAVLTYPISNSVSLSSIRVNVTVYSSGNSGGLPINFEAQITIEGTYTLATNNHAKKSALAMSGH